MKPALLLLHIAVLLGLFENCWNLVQCLLAVSEGEWEDEEGETWGPDYLMLAIALFGVVLFGSAGMVLLTGEGL